MLRPVYPTIWNGIPLYATSTYFAKQHLVGSRVDKWRNGLIGPWNTIRGGLLVLESIEGGLCWVDGWESGVSFVGRRKEDHV